VVAADRRREVGREAAASPGREACLAQEAACRHRGCPAVADEPALRGSRLRERRRIEREQPIEHPGQRAQPGLRLAPAQVGAVERPHGGVDDESGDERAQLAGIRAEPLERAAVLARVGDTAVHPVVRAAGTGHEPE
jgi:hypothetical protein